MDKKKALQIIVQAAGLYKTNLENRKVLFLYGVPSEVRRQIESDMTTLSCIEYYEAAFRRANFLHLTGVHFNPAQVKSAAHFYDKCISGRLSEKDFAMPSDGTADQKLDIIISMMSIHKTATMIGNFTGIGPRLYSEKAAGNVFGCMGFVKDKHTGVNVPNTLLKKDIRDITGEPKKKIFVTMIKPYADNKFKDVAKADKSIDFMTMRFCEDIEAMIER